MAASTEAPDPRSLKSWDDAFQCPIPTVRAMEKKLRSHTTENHNKLRSLVGASYRDLLGTAQTIIEVNGQVVDVETLLRGAAKKTDSRQLDRLSRNRAAYSEQLSAQNSRQHALVSQTSTLFAALDYVAALLKNGEAAIIAAKLLVIARLLYRSVAELREGADKIPVPLKSLGKKISSLRERLLRAIDRRLARPDSDVTQLVEDLAAFTLVTSSSPSEAFTHFRHLRSDVVRNPRTDRNQDLRACIVRRMKLVLNTQSQARSIFPDLLGASLRVIGARSLLSDEAILELDELRLDVHKKWFKDDLIQYTPWTRHDELSGAKAEADIRTWTKSTFEIFVTAVREDLSAEQDIEILADARKHVLQTWLSSRGALRGIDTKECLRELARVFSDHMKHLVLSAAARLTTETSSVVKNPTVIPPSAPSANFTRLWDPYMRETDMSDGAAGFRKAIMDTRHGRSLNMSTILQTLDVQTENINNARKTIQSMKNIRWDDDYDDEDDSVQDDTRDDVPVIEILRRVQPEELARVLRTSTLQAVERLENDLGSDIKGGSDSVSGAQTSSDATRMRLMRGLRARFSTLLMHIDPSLRRDTMFQSQVLNLQRSLARSIDTATSAVFLTSLSRQALRPLHIKAVWDGTPALPVQVSPATFKYLRALVKQMDMSGQDLWTSDQVAILKHELQTKIASVFEEVAAIINSTKSLLHAEGVVDQSEKDGTRSMEHSDFVADDPSDPADGTKEDIDTTDERTGGSVEGELPNGNVDSELDETDSGTPQQHGKNSFRHDKFVQLLFDAFYLQRAFSIRSPSRTSGESQARDNSVPSQASLEEVVENLVGHARSGQEGEDLDDDKLAILKKNAEDYWRRTYLLFGLLTG